ncbi:development-specific protein LVN1.2-like [Strongylocentrotus purpuratus]|uniref:Ependymin-related protein n=1 Tax=Strongylocentrotus purpuratus TaxID=7668 RepID=A0A7M7NFX6_STRPU|nr:development-specific protein LVN1.2-like [Strongylocentrotus purpuratus]XP_030834987.1 development-specific protein LVN1.2-like [Strongylocentrotus purpuratus]
MMFKKIMLVALLAVVTASAKKPCCGPKQFMAGNGGTVGQVDPDSGPQGFFTYQYGAFDYTNRMFGYNMSVTYPNGTQTNIKLIQKYGQGYQYIILEEFQYCQKQPVTKPEPINCIPANATWTSSLFIGGSKGLYADSWTYNFVYPKDPIEGVIVIQVFESNCYPFGTAFIGDRFQGQTRVPMTSSGGLLNMTIGIPDPDAWFTVPSFCPTEMNTFKTREERSAPNLPNLDFFHLPQFY